jgi:hypothetical protein
MIPAEILNYWDNIAEDIARKNDELCDHQVKYEEFSKLKSEEDRKEYLDNHYKLQVYISIKSPFKENDVSIKIKCIPCNVYKFNYCKKEFPLTTEILRKQFMETWKEMHGKE